jgi:hypothetical protein
MSTPPVTPPKGSGMWIAVTAAASLAVVFLIRRFGGALAAAMPAPVVDFANMVDLDALAAYAGEDQGDEPDPPDEPSASFSFLGT